MTVVYYWNLLLDFKCAFLGFCTALAVLLSYLQQVNNELMSENYQETTTDKTELWILFPK